MITSQISVRNLSKTYRVPIREAGLAASLRSLWFRRYRDVEAVKDINLSIEEGEIVGFLGPNGAGKTTTLKMLSGLLYPSSGEIAVAGFVPWKREHAYLRSISMVMGNKSQINWDIPAKDSFLVLGEIYHIPAKELKSSIDELVDLLDVHELLTKPARNLSLGERMKCELVAALLYKPKVLFLDEPTLGLDILIQKRLRKFIAEYNRRSGATVILTSHYMADIEALCPRIIMINRGCIIYDGNLQTLARQVAPYKILRFVLNDEQKESAIIFPADVDVIEHEASSWTLQVRQSEVSAVAAHLLKSLPIIDFVVEDPPIESVIDQVYQGKVL